MLRAQGKLGAVTVCANKACNFNNVIADDNVWWLIGLSVGFLDILSYTSKQFV
jgi:hypothetical protein